MTVPTGPAQQNRIARPVPKRPDQIWVSDIAKGQVAAGLVALGEAERLERGEPSQLWWKASQGIKAAKV